MQFTQPAAATTPALEQAISAIGTRVHERVWPLPLLPEHSEELKGVHSDLHSTGDPVARR